MSHVFASYMIAKEMQRDRIEAAEKARLSRKVKKSRTNEGRIVVPTRTRWRSIEGMKPLER